MLTLSGKPPGRRHSSPRAEPMAAYDKNEVHFSGREFLSETSPEQSAGTVGAPLPRREGAGRVALVGFGTVGRAVARILCQRSDGLLQLTHICNRNVERKKQPWVPGDVIWTEDFHTILRSDAEIIVELIGGLTPAEEFVQSALKAGKSVVTANKQLIARYGLELLQLARENGCQLEFGASVAGGVPVLPALRAGLSGDRLHGIAGILNGTCNYILSRIQTAGIPFSQALEEAQAKGYAEADASEDLDGGDARAKLAILALAGLGVRVAPPDIRARTIRAVDAVDFAYAGELGCTIRQISRAEMKAANLLAEVGPSLVPASSPFGRVQQNLNLVMTSGAYGGEVAFSGAGAGGDPTAVAVVSDLMFVVQNLWCRPRLRRALPALSPKVSCDFETPWYLRFWVKDQPGIIARLAAILSSHQLNIDAVLQKPGFEKLALPFVITLEPCPDWQLHPALEKMSALEFCVKPCLCLPILR